MIKFLLVYKILTNGSVVAGTRSALVDVRLAVKARKSRLTIATGKEKKTFSLMFCLSIKKKDPLANAQNMGGITELLLILITQCNYIGFPLNNGSKTMFLSN